MGNYDHLLAKSIEQGGTTLKSHLESVGYFAQVAAEYAGLDPLVARQGGLLHDIGKASPLFQKRLRVKPSPLEKIFRHEIASLFFLPVADRAIWPQLIEMIVAHHKSIAQDGGELGILDLDEKEGDENFEFHARNFEKWEPEARGLLEELGFAPVSLSVEDAYAAYLYAVNYCNDRKEGWSPWKGLLIGADHFASATSEFQKNLPSLFSIPDICFYERKHELFPLSLIASDKNKKHTFVKAPTGAGKTDFLLKRCRGRIFYTLPFQASLNAMYGRIREDLKGKVEDIRLLHSISRLVVTGNRVEEEKVIQDKFGAAIKIMTPHQIASIAFGVRGYETLLFDLRGCDIILDEIHTYSDIIQSIVLKIVEILANEGCRIHIGTATMPTVLEEAILKILGRESVQYVQLPEPVLNSFNRHIVRKCASFDSVLPIVGEAVEAGQKILLVCNRVANAQNLFSRLEELYPEVDKMLIHSRFRRCDRNRLEAELKNVFNKSERACVVVSTQVVEVSLDISFDLMVTEAAPIDALIQRFGRINRKRNRDTIGKFKYVYVVAPPENDKECKPYKREILKRSYEVLPDDNVLEESSLQRLIDEVYPCIEPIDIDLDAVFVKGNWRLYELWHLPKSALLEKFDIESVSCITQSNAESDYKEGNQEERLLMEIPIPYNSVRGKKLEQRQEGSHPFVIPDCAYSSKYGLELKKIGIEYYDVNYQIF